MRMKAAIIFAAGLAFPLPAMAGQIGITISVAGQQPTTEFRQVTTGQDVEIDLQTITGAADVHVFDVVTNDSEDSDLTHSPLFLWPKASGPWPSSEATGRSH